MRSSVHALSRQAAEHPVVASGARLGLAASGALNAVIGWIALQLAWVGLGSDDDEASATGALDTIAATTVGAGALAVATAGFVLLALWYLTSILLVHRWTQRVRFAGKAVVYGVLGALAVTVLAGASPEGGEAEQASSVTGPFMEHLAGQVLVAAAGVGVAAVGIQQLRKGALDRFCEDLDRHPPRWVVHCGRVGYTTRGFTLVLVGAFLVVAAVNADPEEARGLDGALQGLLDLPFGSFALSAAAVGFMVFGVYSLARARYARI
ncbi:DUF1206 domain-containing protein [Cellulomonas bogoriensis]|uniref:Membrane protein n=1 Tax=Cellulomonas bogoriensis 69B4 = DSM 16987 TaxID=1386082 RepID=A0A0A0BZV8_9CELL|nr:DUF1206 domain-containing protein [Cellulomonas bogoriensis]KGM13480.1 membrane protein [Cellulomonas bogoriensis 69B4 = DSM 16987]